MNRFYATITVPQGHKFPIDMLRYDQCWPLEESHCSWIENTYEDLFGARKPTDIHVCKHSGKSDWQDVWSVERWKSFGGVICTPLEDIPF